MPRRPAAPRSPSRHPFPPPDLPSHSLPLAALDGAWHRVYFPVDRHGKPRSPLALARNQENRFDAPTRRYGVLYVAETLDGAIIETFGRVLGRRVLQLGDLRHRHLATVSATRPLRLVDLTGRGLSLIGADASLAAGHDYEVTQAWSRALYEHPDRPDGIRFRSRHDPSQLSLALFGRCRGALRAQDRGNLLGVVSVEVLSSLLRYDFTVRP